MSTVRLKTNSADETVDLGVKLGGVIATGDLLLLKGAIGSGKTTLARGIMSGAGYKERVRSPSFTLVNEYYCGRVLIRHCDFMRLKDSRQVDELGWEEWLAQGAVVVEWPEASTQFNHAPHVVISLAQFGDNDTDRAITVEARGNDAAKFMGVARGLVVRY